MMYDTAAEDLITLEELCNRLMISESTAYRLMRSGEIKAFKVGSHWKIPSDSVKTFIASRCNPSPDNIFHH